jgi:DNA-binding transcriptional LysR family regulator
VTAAAGHLGITQAAASNALRRLREHFGDPLLVRSGRGLRATPLAERLERLAAAALEAAGAALAPPAAFDPRAAAGVVRVATSDHVDMVVLEPLRRVLAREAPGVALRLEPFAASAPGRALDGALDLLLAPRTQLPEELRVARLLEEPLVVVSRRGHAVSRAGLTAAQLVAHEHIVVTPTGQPGATALDRALAREGLERRVVRYVTSFASALLIVAASELVGVVPRSIAALHQRRLGLALATPPLALPPVRIDAAWGLPVHRDPLHAWVRRRAIEVAAAVSARPQAATAAARANGARGALSEAGGRRGP